MLLTFCGIFLIFRIIDIVGQDFGRIDRVPFAAGGIFKDLVEDGRFVLYGLGLHIDAAVRVRRFRECELLHRVRRAVGSGLYEFEVGLAGHILARKRQPAAECLAWAQGVGVDGQGECHFHSLRQGEVRIFLAIGEVLQNLPLDLRNRHRVNGFVAAQRGPALGQVLVL